MKEDICISPKRKEKQIHMKKKIISLIGAVLIVALVVTVVCLFQPDSADKSTPDSSKSNTENTNLGFVNMYLEGSVRVDEPYRVSYNRGTCQNLTKDVHVICLFLEDDESQWGAENIQTVTSELIPQSMNYIKTWAAQFGYEIDLTYEVCSGIRYNGSIGDKDNNTALDIIPQSAIALGYGSAAEMHEALVRSSGKEQVAYMLFVNKLGRSYATQDRSNDDQDMIEYAVNFSATTSGVLPAPNGFVHEFLHLFGAEDMYAEGTYHANRAVLADQLHYFAIMRRIHSDLNVNIISDFTAYTVGWLDTLPPEYDTENWWS